MEGYTEIVKLAESALNGDIEKSKFWINKFIEKYPDSEFIKPFKALLIGDKNPDRLMCEGKEPSDENSNCNKPLVINWVAITEKLPIVGEWVLCGNNKDEWVDRGTMDDKGNFANDECGIYPTHWAELPEPPCL